MPASKTDSPHLYGRHAWRNTTEELMVGRFWPSVCLMRRPRIGAPYEEVKRWTRDLSRPEPGRHRKKDRRNEDG